MMILHDGMMILHDFYMMILHDGIMILHEFVFNYVFF